MIITKTDPFTVEEIVKLREYLDPYIKTVIDIKRKVCSAGADRHFESEQLLLAQTSKQPDLWGGGIDSMTKIIDFESFINIRPNDNNNSNIILDPVIREKYEKLTKYFFKELL